MFSADHLVHHAQAFQNYFFMAVRNGWFSALAFPEHLPGGEGDDEEIPQRTRFTEELDMPGMNDIVKTGDEYFGSHR